MGYPTENQITIIIKKPDLFVARVPLYIYLQEMNRWKSDSPSALPLR